MTRSPLVSIAGLRQQHLLVALLVVVRGLEQRRALAAVHRAVTKIKL